MTFQNQRTIIGEDKNKIDPRLNGLLVRLFVNISAVLLLLMMRMMTELIEHICQCGGELNSLSTKYVQQTDS